MLTFVERSTICKFACEPTFTLTIGIWLFLASTSFLAFEAVAVFPWPITRLVLVLYFWLAFSYRLVLEILAFYEGEDLVDTLFTYIA